jgi:parallel beta-helix repeat protein
MMIVNNEVARNNTSVYCGGLCFGDAGGSKIIGSAAGTTGLVWRNNNVHDNVGMGIWSDGNVRALYEGNIVSHNSEGGIFHELSWDAIIRNNTVTDNAADMAARSCFWGSQIHVNTSSHVEIYGNTVTASNGTNGICIVASDRGDAAAPYPTGAEDNLVHDNIIKMNGSATSGIVAADGESYSGTAFSTNTYYVTDDTGDWWFFPTLTYEAHSWSEWQGAGQDTGRTLLEW